MSTIKKEALEEYGDLKIGQHNCTVKRTDDLVLLAKEDMELLQGMTGG
jgi:hypothetical protein